MLPNAVVYAIPFFVISVVAEALWLKRHEQTYQLRDAATSIAMGLGNQVIAFVGGTAFIILCYSAAYQFRIIDNLPLNTLTIALCFFLDDFCYYWFHRVSHERRWFWASHIVHHSSRHYNLSTALRQTWTGSVGFTFIFSMPLLVIGFPVEAVLFVGGVNLVYQFWIHTEVIEKMPRWFELLFNTPSHHRVHHATNPQYLDANYAGVFIIWDRLFGTFIAEQKSDKPIYGIIKNIDTYHPFKVAFKEWLNLFVDLKQAKNAREVWCYLFGAPGWSPDGSRDTSADIKRRWKEELDREKPR